MISYPFSVTISGASHASLRASFAHGSALDIAKKAEYLLRPWVLKAMHIDTVKHIVYVAVEHPKGYTFAAISEYRWDEGESCGVHMDFDCAETEGPSCNMQRCGLNVLEKLSPLSDFPDGEDSQVQRQRAKGWRLTCLRKIIRSRKASDEEQAIAYALLTTTKLA